MTQLYEPPDKRLTAITGLSKRAIIYGIEKRKTIPGIQVSGTWLVLSSYVDNLIEQATKPV